MSMVLSEVSIKGFRKAHFEQLLFYVYAYQRSGAYYGNKEQFRNRHDEIKAWVRDLARAAGTEGVIIPKHKREKP